MWKDELTVLAAPMRNPSCFAELRSLLTDAAFTEPECARAWNIFKVITDRGKALTAAHARELAEEVQDQGALRALNEAAVMAAHWHDPVSAGKRNAKAMAKRVHEAAAPQTNVGRAEPAEPEIATDTKRERDPEMASFNKVVVMGNLTRTPELRSTPGGTHVTDITVAVNENYTDQQGAKHESATFVDCTCWGKTAETVCRWKKQGDAVLVEGRLAQDKWQDKETGKNRTKLKVVAESVTFLGVKAESAGGAA